jgi:hypothetical protein
MFSLLPSQAPIFADVFVGATVLLTLAVALGWVDISRLPLFLVRAAALAHGA